MSKRTLVANEKYNLGLALLTLVNTSSAIVALYMGQRTSAVIFFFAAGASVLAISLELYDRKIKRRKEADYMVYNMKMIDAVAQERERLENLKPGVD